MVIPRQSISCILLRPRLSPLCRPQLKKTRSRNVFEDEFNDRLIKRQKIKHEAAIVSPTVPTSSCDTLIATFKSHCVIQTNWKLLWLELFGDENEHEDSEAPDDLMHLIPIFQEKLVVDHSTAYIARETTIKRTVWV